MTVTLFYFLYLFLCLLYLESGKYCSSKDFFSEKAQEGVDIYNYGWLSELNGRNENNIVKQFSSNKEN